MKSTRARGSRVAAGSSPHFVLSTTPNEPPSSSVAHGDRGAYFPLSGSPSISPYSDRSISGPDSIFRKADLVKENLTRGEQGEVAAS